MIKTCKGSNDGINVKVYEEGETYDFSESLAKNFLIMKVAEKVKEGKAETIETEKSLADVIQNKAIQTEDLSNKSGKK